MSLLRAEDLINDANFQNTEHKYRSCNKLFIFDLLEESKISNFISDFEIICKSSYTAKFKIPNTTFIYSNFIYNKCFIPIVKKGNDNFIIKINCKLEMQHPSYCSRFNLQFLNNETNNFENFTKYRFEYLDHNDKSIALQVIDCRSEKSIFIPFDEELGQCNLRLLGEECTIPFNGKLFNLNSVSLKYSINYLPLCWMCFSRPPLIIILLEEKDDDIVIKYRRGFLSDKSNNVYTKYYSNNVLTTNIGSEIFGISDGKGYFIKSL